MIAHFNKLLQDSIELKASDLHISASKPPYLRCQGALVPKPTSEWNLAGMNSLLGDLLNDAQRHSFETDRSLDLAYSLESGDRFRINVFFERNEPALAVRRINDQIQDYHSLHLPEALDRIPELTDGLVLITGPTGSGKTTTLAATIDQINRTKAYHIITIEDPIEQVHQSKKCLIHQRELYRDVPSYFQGVKDALREDPDILLVGEMRDKETMRAAITAAETGHLVFSTLHTGDAVGSINRILGGFSADEQRTLRHQLSMVLRTVVSQHLVPTAARDKRVPIIEVLWATNPVTNHIRTGRVEQIYSIMESGTQQGMLTREQALAEHVSSGLINLDEAMSLAREPKSLIDRLQVIQRDAEEAAKETEEAAAREEFAAS